ncbi:MAG: hypothetical protein BZY88_18170 [SAR202 cluster bacterium Io17-Chloro-G9]|nr:MAG: hypothetical protein BZY88_18170 [SAR202 cluster bacterium Io17-Chloro-G9]
MVELKSALNRKVPAPKLTLIGESGGAQVNPLAQNPEPWKTGNLRSQGNFFAQNPDNPDRPTTLNIVLVGTVLTRILNCKV